jgi:hypothetical protein
LPVRRASTAVRYLTGAEFGPLIWREDSANAEKHLGVSLLQVGPGLRDFIDLSRGLGGVEGIGVQYRFQQNLLLFKICPQIDELKAALLDDTVHLFDLIRGQGEPLSDYGVLPPNSRGSNVEASTHAVALWSTEAVASTEVTPAKLAFAAVEVTASAALTLHA